MGRKRIPDPDKDFVRPEPAANRDDREKQLINLAMNVAEEQMLKGTASAQVITHFLKLGTAREAYERQLMEGQVKLTDAKTQDIEMKQSNQELYMEAIEAIGRYSPTKDDPL